MKWLSTHIMPANCERMVAVAAPRIPQPSQNIKTGAKNDVAPHCQHGGQHRFSGITGGTHDIIQSDHYIGDRTSY